jgi:hypothetical protein
VQNIYKLRKLHYRWKRNNSGYILSIIYVTTLTTKYQIPKLVVVLYTKNLNYYFSHWGTHVKYTNLFKGLVASATYFVYVIFSSNTFIHRDINSFIRIPHCSPLSRGPPWGCRAEIRTLGCHTASRRITDWAEPHTWALPKPMSFAAPFEPRRTLWVTPHPYELRRRSEVQTRPFVCISWIFCAGKNRQNDMYVIGIIVW